MLQFQRSGESELLKCIFILVFSQFMSENGQIKLGIYNIADFQASVVHYLKLMDYDKTRENELNESEFIKFWLGVYDLFDKIDKNGNGEISVVECVRFLEEKATEWNLDTTGTEIPYIMNDRL